MTWQKPAWFTLASGTRSSDTMTRRPASLPIWPSGAALVVAMEQLESSQQAEIDRFNRGELDFDGLARAIDWGKQWPKYRQYRPVLEAARKAKAPVIGLSPKFGRDPRGRAIRRRGEARSLIAEETAGGIGASRPGL